MAHVYVDVDIDESDFSDKELIGELVSRGYAVSKGFQGGDFEANFIELGRIEHLAMCGQVEAAKSELLDMVSKTIGRDLTH